MIQEKTRISDQEWKELDALRKAISFNPATVAPESMEKFTELFVETIRGYDDIPPYMMNQTDENNSN